MRWLLVLVVLAGSAAASPLLVAVAPDLPGSAPGDEGFAVAAPTATDLLGWTVTDGEGTWTFPAGTHLDAGIPLWVVGNATRWSELGGDSPFLAAGTGALQLGNSGDSLALRDPAGAVADAMAWGDGKVAGFSGTLPQASAGLILQRQQVAGAWQDTDLAKDWQTPRLHRIGESHLDRPTFEVHHLTLYASPDSSFQVLTALVAGASDRLHLHVYELRSQELVDALVAAKAAHPTLDLQVLVDGDPVGASAADRHASADALRRIEAGGGRAVVAGNGRYDDHHLKVLVADGAVAVQSENWVASGVPRDPSWGNRGWGVVVHDRAAADWFAAWMQSDRDSWDAQPFDLATFDPTFVAPLRAAPRSGDYGPVVAPRELDDTFHVTPTIAPDHTQDPAADPIATLAAGARSRLDVQQLDVRLGNKNALGWSGSDPLADAMTAAVARGVAVRVQAAAPFSATDTGNKDVLALLAQRGAQTQVMARPGIATLHNKGIVADDAVVVGSLNGNQHSRAQNREADVIVTGPGVADYYDGLFNGDWTGASPGRDWSVPGRDLHALPLAPWPILLAVAGVAASLARRWS